MKKIALISLVGLISTFICTVAFAGDNRGYSLKDLSQNGPGNGYSFNDMFTEEASRSADASSRRNNIRGRIEVGGSLGLSFGNYTSINISPQIGYRFNRYVAFGGGFSYNYYEDKFWDYSLNYFGINLYTRVYPIPYFHIYLQPEVVRRWGHVRNHKSDSEVFACFLVGGGFSVPIGYTGAMNFTLFYDVVQNYYTPYGNNVGYSVGYTFGF